MTGGELAALVFRVLGVVLLLSGLAQALLQLLGAVQEDWLVWGLLGLALTLFFTGAVALPLIFHSESLVAWLFPKSEKSLSVGVTRSDLLACGLALVGAWLLATNLPFLARLGVEVFWGAGAGRRPELDDAYFTGAAFDAIGSVFSCVAGWALFRYSGRISDWWESRVRGGS